MLTPEEIAASVYVALDIHVRAIYRATRHHDDGWSIGVDREAMRPREVVAAHYALLEKMSRADASRILFFDSDRGLPRGFDPVPMQISSAMRDVARRRMEAFVPEPEPIQPPDGRTGLVARTQKISFGRGRPRVAFVGFHDEYPAQLFATRTNEIQFLNANIHALMHERFADLVIVEFTPDRATAFLEKGCPNFVVWKGDASTSIQWDERGLVIVRKPIGLNFIRGVLQIASNAMPDPFPRKRTEVAPETQQARRILVLEKDTPYREHTRKVASNVGETHAPVDVWQILDLVQKQDFDLVLCDATWRTPSFEPVHRLVRRLRPEIGEKIVLLANREPDPPNARVLARPIAKEGIVKALQRIGDQ